MDAVTYPNAKVIEFINQHLVALRVLATQEPLATDFRIVWTPALLILDAEGTEHNRTVGFLAPEELIPSLLLGMGHAHFHRNQFQEALGLYERVLADYPGSDSAAEALFQRGVALFKSTHDPKPLKEAYTRLEQGYPNSPWTKRAAPYRLLD